MQGQCHVTISSCRAFNASRQVLELIQTKDNSGYFQEQYGISREEFIQSYLSLDIRERFERAGSEAPEVGLDEINEELGRGFFPFAPAAECCKYTDNEAACIALDRQYAKQREVQKINDTILWYVYLLLLIGSSACIFMGNKLVKKNKALLVLAWMVFIACVVFGLLKLLWGLWGRF